MIINNKEYDVNALTNEIMGEKSIIKNRGKGIYLSDEEVDILKRYEIDYKRFSSLNMLIFEIEEVLNEEDGTEDLEELSARLSELNYYNNTNK